MECITCRPKVITVRFQPYHSPKNRLICHYHYKRHLNIVNIIIRPVHKNLFFNSKKSQAIHIDYYILIDKGAHPKNKMEIVNFVNI